MDKLVAIQTPHYAHNYGAVLQAFALGQIVREIGFDVEYIDRRSSYYDVYSCIFDKWHKKLRLKTEGKGFVDFETTYLQPQSIRILKNEDYNKLDTSRYAAIIVGSDQIWRDDYFIHSFEYSPYLYFVKNSNVKKISYAASFGKDTCSHPEERRRNIEKMLKDFYAISVREKSGVDILKNVFHVAGKWVADPTLLHDADFYIKKLQLKKQTVDDNRIVTYILGASPTNMKKVDDLAKKIGVSTKHIYKRSKFWLAYKRPFSLLRKYRMVPSVIEWLENIMNAKYVFTDSFHGMVFCIIFRKQFVVLNNKAGGTERFISLLNRLGLSERLCNWDEDIEQIQEKLCSHIDYNNAENLLNEFKDLSVGFLRVALYE